VRVILLAIVGNIVLHIMVMWMSAMLRFAIVMTLVEMEQYVTLDHA